MTTISPGVLVVTGASRGIGAATAVLGARRGYRVCVNYVRNKAAADAVLDVIPAWCVGGETLAP